MLGSTLLMKGDHAAAVDALELAIRLNPDQHVNHYNLGMALEKLGRPDAAIQHYEDCLDLTPDTLQARQRLEFLQNR